MFWLADWKMTNTRPARSQWTSLAHKTLDYLIWAGQGFAVRFDLSCIPPYFGSPLHTSSWARDWLMLARRRVPRRSYSTCVYSFRETCFSCSKSFASSQSSTCYAQTALLGSGRTIAPEAQDLHFYGNDVKVFQSSSSECHVGSTLEPHGSKGPWPGWQETSMISIWQVYFFNPKDFHCPPFCHQNSRS